jgi:hypothetical protein
LLAASIFTRLLRGTLCTHFAGSVGFYPRAARYILNPLTPFVLNDACNIFQTPFTPQVLTAQVD